MEDFLTLAGLLLIAITAMTPIVKTTITEKGKTQRARISAGEKANMKQSAAAENQPISPVADAANRYKGDGLFGLLALFFASAQLGWLQFGLLHSEPLSIGAAAAIAQAISLLGMGWFLLTRR